MELLSVPMQLNIPDWLPLGRSTILLLGALYLNTSLMKTLTQWSHLLMPTTSMRLYARLINTKAYTPKFMS